jgi:hypothetical protein
MSCETHIQWLEESGTPTAQHMDRDSSVVLVLHMPLI